MVQIACCWSHRDGESSDQWQWRRKGEWFGETLWRLVRISRLSDWKVRDVDC